jgi:NhaP-type Na+/H+ or K+/H+ antiporter
MVKPRGSILIHMRLSIGVIPELREIELPPETVLLLFLPVTLFWESLTTSLRSARRWLHPTQPLLRRSGARCRGATSRFSRRRA